MNKNYYRIYILFYWGTEKFTQNLFTTFSKRIVINTIQPRNHGLITNPARTLVHDITVFAEGGAEDLQEITEKNWH